MSWFELDFYGGIAIWFKRNFEYVIVIFKPISHLYQVDVVVEREVRINHNNPERINGNFNFQIQKDLEDVNKLGNDALAIKEIAAPRNLDRAVRKNLNGLGTVGIVVGQCNLVIESGRFKFPFKPGCV
ncbi:hypothetical protein OAA36_01455 [Candidatus Pelagibacter sp.]|nr:hypothetical protein [Candidatus Pelagibacter sp.]